MECYRSIALKGLVSDIGSRGPQIRLESRGISFIAQAVVGISVAKRAIQDDYLSGNVRLGMARYLRTYHRQGRKDAHK